MRQNRADHLKRDPVAVRQRRKGVPKLMIVPISAQPPLGRLDCYAEVDEKVFAGWDVGGD